MQTRGAGGQTTDLLIRKQPVLEPQSLCNTDPANSPETNLYSLGLILVWNGCNCIKISVSFTKSYKHKSWRLLVAYLFNLRLQTSLELHFVILEILSMYQEIIRGNGKPASCQLYHPQDFFMLWQWIIYWSSNYKMNIVLLILPCLWGVYNHKPVTSQAQFSGEKGKQDGSLLSLGI